MHKKSQGGMFVLFGFLIIGLIYFVGLAPMVSLTAQVAVADNGYTGLWAWFLINLNVFITIFYIISGLAIGRYSLG